jgi:hypothetical protein
MWLTGRLAPDFKTIADFRKDNGPANRPASGPARRCLLNLLKTAFSHGLHPSQPFAASAFWSSSSG